MSKSFFYLFITLALAFSQQNSLVYAQETTDQTISPDVTKEFSVDIKKQLNLVDYDPIVPRGIVGNVGYFFKSIGREAQEAAYRAFASDASNAKLLQDHANQKFVEAMKVYNEDPKEIGTFVNLLDGYKSNLNKVSRIAGALKDSNPDGAKNLTERIATEQLFTQSKVLSGIQDTIAGADPDSFAQFLAIKNDSLKAAGNSLVSASSDPSQLKETLKNAATETGQTAFSPIAQAQIINQIKSQIDTGTSNEFQAALNEAVSDQVKQFESNFAGSKGNESAKAEQLQKFISQLPGKDLNLIKVAGQIRSQGNLSPDTLAKIQEAKSNIAQYLGSQIQNLSQSSSGTQNAVNQALLNTRTPDVSDLQALTEVKDLVPTQQIRDRISTVQEGQVERFLDKFGSDKNAAQVTDEFKSISAKIQSGQILPDANYFKTLDSLKSRLNPEQQQFIDNMSKVGEQQIITRIKDDPNFAQRVTTSNPADIQVFQKVQERIRTGDYRTLPPDFTLPEQANSSAQNPGSRGGVLTPPSSADLNQFFNRFDRQQTQNFQSYLGTINNPDDIKNIEQNFKDQVPAEVQQKLRQQFNFDSNSEFQKQQGLAGQRQQDLEQRYGAPGSVNTSPDQNRSMPSGTNIPSRGTTMPSDSTMPQGTMPSRTGEQKMMQQMPSGSTMPSGTAMPSGTRPSGETMMPPSGSTMPSGTMMPQGTMPSQTDQQKMMQQMPSDSTMPSRTMIPSGSTMPSPSSYTEPSPYTAPSSYTMPSPSSYPAPSYTPPSGGGTMMSPPPGM